MRILLFFIACSFTIFSFGQNPVAYFNLNDCTSTDVTGNNPSGTINGGPNCLCGIEGDAMEFDGIDDYIEFDTVYTDYFQQDFTLSFAFMLNNPTNPVDIISLQRLNCVKDSSMTFKYIPVTNEFQVEYSLTFGQSIRVRTQLDVTRCWNHIAFTKKDNEYSLYLNGLSVDTDKVSFQILMHPEATLKVANGPCLGLTDERFRGYLDEFKIFNLALNSNEIFALYSPVDLLISQDTTLFIGDAIQIQSETSCAANINWNPTFGVNNISISEPQITPNQTTLYFIEYDHGICQALDSINLVVADPNAIDCSVLLLPNAFTPNNDGRNDMFGISNAFIIEEFISFEIFDRWGGRVFNASDKNDSWTGFLNGTSVNPGYMMYRVRYKCGGEEFVKIGSFSLLR